MDTLRQGTGVLFSDAQDDDVQSSMERFSLITHTFGTPAILAGRLCFSHVFIFITAKLYKLSFLTRFASDIEL